MGKVNIDFTPTKYNADDAPDLVTGAYNQSMDDLKTALDNATAEDSGGGGDITYPIPVDKGGTNANNATDARANLGITLENIGAAAETDLANYLPLTGGTLTGILNTRMLNVGSYNDNTEHTFSVRRGFNLDSNEPTQVQAMVNVGSDQALFSFRGSDNSHKNYLQLLEDKTRLKNPLAVDSGGTNATDAYAALYNLAGNIPPQNNDLSDETNFILRRYNPSPTNGTFMYVKSTRVWDWIKTKVLEARKTIELTINIVDNEGEIDGHQIPKSEGTIIPLCVHGKHTATPVVFGFDVDEDDTNYLLYIYAQTKSQVDSITVVFEYLAF